MRKYKTAGVGGAADGELHPPLYRGLIGASAFAGEELRVCSDSLLVIHEAAAPTLQMVESIDELLCGRKEGGNAALGAARANLNLI